MLFKCTQLAQGWAGPELCFLVLNPVLSRCAQPPLGPRHRPPTCAFFSWLLQLFLSAIILHSSGIFRSSTQPVPSSDSAAGFVPTSLLENPRVVGALSPSAYFCLQVDLWLELAALPFWWPQGLPCPSVLPSRPLLVLSFNINARPCSPGCLLSTEMRPGFSYSPKNISDSTAFSTYDSKFLSRTVYTSC